MMHKKGGTKVGKLLLKTDLNDKKAEEASNIGSCPTSPIFGK